MNGWLERRRRRRARARARRDSAEREIRRRFWEGTEDASVESLSRRRRPLNELFEHGSGLPGIESLLEYVAALERRVDRLENPKPPIDAADAERRR